MAQLNLYVPDEVADRLKREANRAGLPLSRYVSGILHSFEANEWPPDFFNKRCGFLQEDIPEPPDSRPETVEAVE